jgi:hypothetical protein
MADKTEARNLYQRLLDITSEIGKIEKTGTNTAQNYKFIEQAQVLAELRPKLATHGVMIMPETISRTMDRYVTTKPGYKPTDPPKEQVSFHANVVSRYTVINADNPDERFTCEWDAGEALDTSDKATNKATTASQKYFLMKLFNISDKDDPDADTLHPTRKQPANEHPKEPARDLSADEPISEKNLNALVNLLDSKGLKDHILLGGVLKRFALEMYDAATIKEITNSQAVELHAVIKGMAPEALTSITKEVK